MRLIAIGRLRDGPEAELFARYNARLRPKLAVTEIAEARGAPAEVKRRENEALLAAIPEAAFVVALDSAGTPSNSDELARNLDRWLASGRSCFEELAMTRRDAPADCFVCSRTPRQAPCSVIAAAEHIDVAAACAQLKAEPVGRLPKPVCPVAVQRQRHFVA